MPKPSTRSVADSESISSKAACELVTSVRRSNAEKTRMRFIISNHHALIGALEFLFRESIIHHKLIARKMPFVLKNYGNDPNWLEKQPL